MTRRRYQENNCFAHLSNEIKTLRDEFGFVLLSEPPQWRAVQNVITNNHKIQFGHPLLGLAYAQSEHALRPRQRFFKVYCSTLEGRVNDEINFHIGLTLEDFFRVTLFSTVRRIEDLQSRAETGRNFISNIKCKNGAVVVCGIHFPPNFIDDGNHSGTVYLSVNEKIKFQKSFPVPKNGFFPSIIFTDNKTVLRYYQKIN